MAYKIDWYIEGEIIYIQNSLDSNKREINTLLRDINSYIDQSQHPLVHVINDLSQVTRTFNLVEIAQSVKDVRPNPRMGWVIMVGEQDKLVKFISSIARQLLHLRQRSYATLPEALDFLHDMDTNLDWSQAKEAVLVFADQDNPTDSL